MTHSLSFNLKGIFEAFIRFSLEFFVIKVKRPTYNDELISSI